MTVPLDFAVPGMETPDKQGPPLRVLHVITNLHLGGAQISVVGICEGLRKCGIDVQVACSPVGAGGNLLRRLGESRIAIHEVPQMTREPAPWKDLRALLRLCQVIRDVRPDVVHTHLSKAGVLGRLAARIAGVPHVVHSIRTWSFYAPTSRLKKRMYVAVESLASRLTDRFVAVSRQLIRDGLDSGLGLRERSTVIRSGICPGRFRGALDERDRRRGELGLDADAALVGTVMRLEPAKAPGDFVLACARIAAQAPATRFLLVGDGCLHDEVSAELRSCGLADRVQRLGARGDVDRLLPLMDVFLLTSRWEGMPRVVMEAVAAGVPVVSTRVGGVPELIQHGVSGLLAPIGDVQCLAAHVLRLLADPALGRDLARAASQRLGEEYDLDRVVQDHVRLYGRLAAPGASR